MKRLLFILIAATMLCSIPMFSACSSPDDEEEEYISGSNSSADIKVSPTSVTIHSYSGGSATVYVTSTGSWTSSRIGAWIDYTPKSGKAGKTKVTIKVGKTTKHLDGSLTFKTNGDSVKLPVRQRSN